MNTTALQGRAPEDGRITSQHSTSPQPCPPCCTSADAAVWINDTAEAALDGDEDMARLLPDVCNHYLGYSIVHLPPGTSPRRIIETLDGEVEP